MILKPSQPRRNNQIGVNVDDSTHEVLRALAYEYKTNMSTYVNSLLDYLINKDPGTLREINERIFHEEEDLGHKEILRRKGL